MKDVVECKIVSRLNRFVVEVKVDGIKRKAHINNTGRLKELLVKGKRGYCIKAGVKTDYKLFGIKIGRHSAVIDTQLQMRAFEESLNKNLIPWLNDCKILKRNVKLNKSVVDYLIRCDGVLYLEAKSAALKRNKYAMYPDCPSMRGRKHIAEITNHVRSGNKAVILFIAAIPNVRAFKPNKRGDKIIFKLLKDAFNAGVVVKSISIYYNPSDSHIHLKNPDLEVKL